MTNSMLQWHLARDNQIKLARFCEKNAVRHDNVPPYTLENGESYFRHTYHFDNGSFIEAEMRAGDTRSYSIADHFQVTDYGWGNTNA